MRAGYSMPHWMLATLQPIIHFRGPASMSRLFFRLMTSIPWTSLRIDFERLSRSPIKLLITETSCANRAARVFSTTAEVLPRL
jgi:hypothetical protein